MGQPAARLTDMHVCPMVTPGLPPIPHVGGPIITPGAPNVIIGGLPAATIGCMCMCVGPPDAIIRGSLGVMIGGRPAARMGDNTAHGGTIVLGFPMVLIGDIGMGSVGGGAVTPEIAIPMLDMMPPAMAKIVAQIATLSQAAASGAALVEVCKG